MGEKGTGEGVWKDVRDTEGLREEVLFKGDGGGQGKAIRSLN